MRLYLHIHVRMSVDEQLRVSMHMCGVGASVYDYHIAVAIKR